jgi:hypothetical protein
MALSQFRRTVTATTKAWKDTDWNADRRQKQYWSRLDGSQYLRPAALIMLVLLILEINGLLFCRDSSAAFSKSLTGILWAIPL